MTWFIFTLLALSGWVAFSTVIKSNTELREDLARKTQTINALDFQLQKRIHDIQMWKELYYTTSPDIPEQLK